MGTLPTCPVCGELNVDGRLFIPIGYQADALTPLPEGQGVIIRTCQHCRLKWIDQPNDRHSH